MTDEKLEVTDYLLEVYHEDYGAEADRRKRIRDKASDVFAFASSVSAVLVGLYALGESLAEVEMWLLGLMPYLFFYALGVVLFAIAAFCSLMTVFVTSVKVPYFPTDTNEVIKLYEKQISYLKQKRLRKLVEAMASIDKDSTSKARFLFISQTFTLLATACLAAAMFMILLGVIFY